VPIAAPALLKLGVDPIWLGVMIGMNLQASFLTPPFGFALFFLQSLADAIRASDRITGRRIPAVNTAQIYKGSIAFIVLQLIMVGVVLFNPQLVTGSLETAERMDPAEALEQLRSMGRDAMEAIDHGSTPAASEPGTAPSEDPMKMLLESLQQDKQGN
jgi:predicted histidine transporter YuiF (NhaC family)